MGRLFDEPRNATRNPLFFMGMRGFQVGCNWDYEALLASSMARHPYHRTTPAGSGIWYGGGPKMFKF